MTSPNSRRSRRVKPPVMVSLITELSCVAASKGLSSGQTIGAARTDVRSACCLPELRGANRLRRLYPLDDGELFKFNLKSSVCQRQTGLPKGNLPCVFPSFPFGNLPKAIERPIGLQVLLLRRSRRVPLLDTILFPYYNNKGSENHPFMEDRKEKCS